MFLKLHIETMRIHILNNIICTYLYFTYIKINMFIVKETKDKRLLNHYYY